MARVATKEELAFDDKSVNQEFDSGAKVLSPKSAELLINGEKLTIKKWNLGQLTELGEEIANIILAINDSREDSGMVMAILSAKLPIVVKVSAMTTGKSEEWCKEIDGDELMDLYDVCKGLNESFFRRLSAALPESLQSLPTNPVEEKTQPQTSQEENPEPKTTGSI